MDNRTGVQGQLVCASALGERTALDHHLDVTVVRVDGKLDRGGVFFHRNPGTDGGVDGVHQSRRIGALGDVALSLVSRAGTEDTEHGVTASRLSKRRSGRNLGHRAARTGGFSRNLGQVGPLAGVAKAFKLFLVLVQVCRFKTTVEDRREGVVTIGVHVEPKARSRRGSRRLGTSLAEVTLSLGTTLLIALLVGRLNGRGEGMLLELAVLEGLVVRRDGHLDALLMRAGTGHAGSGGCGDEERNESGGELHGVEDERVYGTRA